MDVPKHAVITSFLSTTKDRFHQYNPTKTLTSYDTHFVGVVFLDHLSVQEQQRAHRLIVAGGGHAQLVGQIREEALDVVAVELRRV